MAFKPEGKDGVDEWRDKLDSALTSAQVFELKSVMRRGRRSMLHKPTKCTLSTSLQVLCLRKVRVNVYGTWACSWGSCMACRGGEEEACGIHIVEAVCTTWRQWWWWWWGCTPTLPTWEHGVSTGQHRVCTHHRVCTRHHRCWWTGLQHKQSIRGVWRPGISVPVSRVIAVKDCGQLANSESNIWMSPNCEVH